MAKNKYGEYLKDQPHEFWLKLISLEAYIGVVISPTKFADTSAELLRLVHFIYWTAPEPGMTFPEAVYSLQAQIDLMPRQKRKQYQRAARAKLLPLDRRQVRAVVYGNGIQPENRGDFYKSWDWRTLRMQVLRRHGARCQCCGASPCDFDTAGNPVKIVVDHIKPLATHWHLRLEPTNLQILCDECNQGKGAWDETDYRPSH